MLLLQHPARPSLPPAAGATIQVSWASHQDEVREAQRLRHAVFAGEMGARLDSRLPGHDVDIFDDFCEHLLVRDAHTRQVLGTYRLLTPTQAKRIGSTYSDTEFDLTRLRSLRGDMVEIRRSCVHRDQIMRKARKGCRVIFIPGNHDEFARQFAGHHFGGIKVALDAVHVTAAGRRLWIIHGDAFDGVVQCARWLAVVGDNLYELTLRMNRHLNRLRRRFGLPYWSLSAYLKHKVKTALNYVTDFEKAVAAEARRRGHDGVVCGHIHRAEMRQIDGTLYCNDGDWVESRTALVEHPDGRLELRHWTTRDANNDTVAAAEDAAFATRH